MWPRHAALLVVCAIMLVPFYWVVKTSLTGENIYAYPPRLLPQAPHLFNYVDVWYLIPFPRYLLNSVIVTVLVVTVGTFSSTMAAFALAKLDFPHKRTIFVALLATIMIPLVVLIIPQFLVFVQLGWIDTILPLVAPRFLAVDAFFIFLMVQFFRGIPRELDEAAMMDGCSAWRIYWKVMLPLSTPVLATAAIFTFIWTWDDFFAPLIYLNEMKQYTVMLGLRTFTDSTGESDFGGLFAMSVLSLVPIFLFFLFFQRLLIEGIATTGMKR